MENNGPRSRPGRSGSASEAGAGFSRADCIAIAVTTALLIALAIWLISPRFSITGTSLVDDWSNLDNSQHALDELAELSYDPAEVHDSRRYRPSYTAVWNSLQWRTVGAPENMTGPNFWAVVRVALLVGGSVLLAAFSLIATSRRRLTPVAIAGWASIPGLLLLASPLLVVDLARQGPSEPLMFGGMAVGGLLVLFALRRLLARAGEDRRQLGIAIATLVLGYALWLFGIYQKEASICALALLVPLYVVLDRRWRSHGVIDQSLHRYRSVRVVAVLLVLPLVHMLYEIAHVTKGGETVYGAHVPSGLSGWVTRLGDSAEIQWNSAVHFDAFLWIGVAATIPFLLLAWIGSNRRIPWLALGLLVTAVATYLFQGLAGVAVTRYLIPVVIPLSTAAILLLVDGPRWLRLAALTGVVVFAAQGLDDRSVVRGWADYQEARIESVREVAQLDPWRCPTYMALLHAEDADAVPEVVGREPRPAGRGCDPPYKGYMVLGGEAGDPVTNEAIYRTCAGPGWVEVKSTKAFRVLGCRRFAAGSVLDQDVEKILRWNRLVPGQRLSERIHSFPDSALCQSPLCMPLLTKLRETYR